MSNPVQFECIVPILRVADLRASLDYYQTKLGFALDWPTDKPEAIMAGLSRDGLKLYLVQGEQGQPGTWLWIGVHDVTALHAELVASGANIVMEPTQFSWAYELRVEDPDGHVLRFGSAPLW